MPFKAGNLGDLDKHPISGTEIEASRTFDDQVGHSGWQHNTSGHQSLAFTHESVEDSVDELNDPDNEDSNNDFVEGGSVDYQEGPECPVKQVCAVEYLGEKGKVTNDDKIKGSIMWNINQFEQTTL